MYDTTLQHKSKQRSLGLLKTFQSTQTPFSCWFTSEEERQLHEEPEIPYEIPPEIPPETPHEEIPLPGPNVIPEEIPPEIPEPSIEPEEIPQQPPRREIDLQALNSNDFRFACAPNELKKLTSFVIG
jgi:hypothetical protein